MAETMELYFETYVILALFFVILGFVIAGPFLKTRKYTIWLSVLVLFLVFFVPNFLIVLQSGWGSLAEIGDLRIWEPLPSDNMTPNELRHYFYLDQSFSEFAWHIFIKHIVVLVGTEIAGLAVGVLAFRWYRRKYSK
jgi:hypothetical protein